MPPLNLYARVRFLLVHFAHETAGAARTRLSLRPLIERVKETFRQTSGEWRREIAKACLSTIGGPRKPRHALAFRRLIGDGAIRILQPVLTQLNAALAD
jgi:hypothetical protein